MQIENLLSEKNSPNKETHFIKSRSFLSNDSFFKSIQLEFQKRAFTNFIPNKAGS